MVNLKILGFGYFDYSREKEIQLEKMIQHSEL